MNENSNLQIGNMALEKYPASLVFTNNGKI